MAKKEHEKKMHEKKHHEKKKHEKKMKEGGHVEGHKGAHHMGKYARGGGTKSAAEMTPTSPLSGAGKMMNRKDLKASSTDESDD